MEKYSKGQLRIVRDSRSTLNPATPYNVEEVPPPNKQINKERMSERDALQLMADLGSPYPGPRYPDTW